jgi:hypothetical protein
LRSFDTHSSATRREYCSVWPGAEVFTYELEEGTGEDNEIADYKRDPELQRWKSNMDEVSEMALCSHRGGKNL